MVAERSAATVWEHHDQGTPVRTHGRRIAAAIAATPLALTGLAAGPGGDRTAGPNVLAAFDFDDGLQGWTVETDGLSGVGWEVLPDRDDWDNGPNGRHAGDPGFDQLDAPDGDHHVAIEFYPNHAVSTAISPTLPGDGSTVELIMDLRAWTEGSDFDYVDVQWRPSDGEWQLLDRAQGRGHYPLWERFSSAFTPAGDFEVGVHFFSDDLTNGSNTITPQDPDWLSSNGRLGFGAWFDDVVITRGGSTSAPGSDPTVRSTGHASSGHHASRDDHGERSDFATSPTDPAGLDLPAPRIGVGPRDVVRDRLAHVEHRQLRSTGTHSYDERWSDPYSWDWDGGRERRVWIVNRYGAPLSATMFAPHDDGPHPTIVFAGWHGGGDAAFYRSVLMRIAESGYLVLSVAPQSPHALYTTWSPATDPADGFCGAPEETADLWWRQPQEGGLAEHGFCAGHEGPGPSCVAGQVQALECTLLGTTGPERADLLDEGYQRTIGPPWTFAAVDAAHWLVGRTNPWRRLVDRNAIGVAGHSIGGFGAVVAANADSLVKAAVAIDEYGRRPPGLELTVPTLMVNYDSAYQSGPAAADPLSGIHANPLSIAREARDQDLDTGFVVVADAEHGDFTYWPDDDASIALRSSRWARSVTLHYLLAWFDLHLRGDTTATHRLTSSTFDDTTDRTAWDVGRWDPAQGNMPYRIGGDPVASHLSPRMPSWVHLDGQSHDLR